MKMIKVSVLKTVPVKNDALGITTRTILAGTNDEIPDDILEMLSAEGYVALPGAATAKPGDVVVLVKLSRPDLIKEADKRGVAIESDDTKAEIIAKIEAAAAGGGTDAVLTKLLEDFKAQTNRPEIHKGAKDGEFVVTGPWAKLVLVSKEMLDAKAPFLTTDDKKLLLTVSNGEAEYEARGETPDGTLYELVGEPKYAAAPAA